MRIVASDIGIAFGNRPILEKARFTATSGELLGLMGPSGSGKSTLLSIFAGETRPDAGTVSFMPDEYRVTWILQSTPLLARRTAIENVALGPLSSGHPSARATALAFRSMQRLSVAHTSNEKVFRLSGGERQRLAVARAIAAETDVILADEPTASLDPVSREAVCSALAAAAGQGAIVIVATHDPFVASQCSTVFALTGGLLEAAESCPR